MTCSRGKANPDSTTKLKLFADSGGYCQNPSCNEPIFAIIGEAHTHFAEMAHIFSAVDGGPRTNSELSEEKRGAFDNLIILCPKCHTIIDKREDAFPDHMVSMWKLNHSETIKRALQIASFDVREEFVSAISEILTENEYIHKRYGPDNEYRFNPESEEASAWSAKIKSKIIPNNRKALMIFDSNKIHLTHEEQMLVHEFRQHIDDLERKHLFGEDISSIRFPEQINRFKVRA